MNDNVADFKLLPTRIVFGFDYPNDQIAHPQQADN